MSSANIFHQAIVNRDLETIKRILKEGHSWKATDNDGETVLHLAFKRKNQCMSNQKTIIQILECFLHEGLSVNLKNAAGQTVLFSAIENRLRHVIDYLVQRGANLNARDQEGNSIIHILIEDQFKQYPKNASSDLLEFVEQDNINFMNWLLSKGVNVDCRNNDGKTAFIFAVERNLNYLLPILMKYMNDVNHIDKEGCTIMESFFEARLSFNKSVSVTLNDFSQDIEIIKFFLEKGVSVDHTDNKGNPLFHTYLQLNDQSREVMQCMLQHYTKLDAQDQYGNTALHHVIMNNIMQLALQKNCSIDTVRTLLSKGANVNLKNHAGETVVHFAVQFKYIEAFKALLEFGADVSSSNNVGTLFLHDISSVRSTEDQVWAPMVDVLVRAGWNVNEVRPDDQLTPLMEACRCRCPAIAQKLIDNGANVNYVEKQDLMRPIHMAMISCMNRDANTAVFIEMLTTAGAEINVKNRRGQTALHLVPVCGYTTMKKLLMLGAHVDARDDLGRLPLHEAAGKRDKGAVKALLQFGAEVNDEILLRELNNIEVLLDVDHDIVVENRTADYLTQHWLKLKAANLPAIDGFAEFAKTNSLQEFYVECLIEVETLKTLHLNGQTTLYDLLHMDVHFNYVFIANHKKLKELLDSQLLKINFPKYHILINASYIKAVVRYPLIEPAKRAWHYLTGIELPDCVEPVLAYLENEDLRTMAEEEEEETVVSKSLKRPSQVSLDEPTKRQRLE